MQVSYCANPKPDRCIAVVNRQIDHHWVKVQCKSTPRPQTPYCGRHGAYVQPDPRQVP